MEHEKWLQSLVILTTLMTSTLANRIIDGEQAVLGQFPYVAFLETVTDGIIDMEVCTASIVTTTWAITAAHCTHADRSYKLTAGTLHGLHKESDAQIRNVARIINHPDYQRKASYHDISLIEVEVPFIWTEFVQPIPLENIFRRYKPGECVAAGFGRTSVPISRHGDTKTRSFSLNYLNFYSEVSSCSRLGYTELLENQLCTTFLGYTNLYFGDSGGPLVCNNKLVGVASFIFPTRIVSLNVHTAVAYFYQWIKEHIDVHML